MSTSETERTCSPESKTVAQANNHLAVHLHRLLAEEEGNVFFSPFSISTAMAMLLCGAIGETESEMRAALGYDDAGIKTEDAASIFQMQISTLVKKSESYTLACANSMLSQKDLHVKGDYKTILVESFKALLLEVDFQKNSEKITNQVNDWVKEKTNNMIPKLVEFSLSPATVLILLNAVYFKGSWLRKFDESSTFTKKFYNKGSEDNAKNVNMMSMKEAFPFVEKEKFKALQLPYAGEEIAMLILLPNSRNGLVEMESSITSHFVHELKNDLHKRKVQVNLPRFRLEYSKSLVSAFQRLGVNRVFKQAELAGICDSKNLAVSEIFHKAVLDVNEEGSEAAAATMIVAVRMCAPIRNPEFIADHPFLFLIYHTKSDLILFMGRVDEL